LEAKAAARSSSGSRGRLFMGAPISAVVPGETLRQLRGRGKSEATRDEVI
jgi:hypothetical protein